MAKYDPLRDYLRRQRTDALVLSFVEIERKLGYMLPNVSVRPEWWACPGDPGLREVQKQAWRAAGWDAVLIPGADSVRFTRLPAKTAPA